MTAATASPTAAAAVAPFRFGDDRDWFFQRRLGLFIHWGLYALDAWQEQDIWRRRRSREEYARLASRFNPATFDPDHWIDAAQAAGMSYLCFTTKHLDGFCLWQTATTDFNVTRTPYGQDVLAQLAAACHRRAFPLCLYLSVVDLHHPAYPHQGRRWEFPASLAGDRPSREVYLDYLRRQVVELCTQYGKLHGFWWDGNPAHWQDPSLNELIRQLQPGILINNRGLDSGDYGTPERDWDTSVDTELAFSTPIEACQSLGSQSWGHRAHEDYYTDKHLLRSIAKVLAKGGNYLLNSGPDANGRLGHEDQRLLNVIGHWFLSCREAWVDTQPCSHLTSNRDILLTRRGRTLYVILHREPSIRSVPLRPFDCLPISATLLNTGESVSCRLELLPWDHTENRAYLRLHHLPLSVLNDTVPILRIDFAEDLAEALPAAADQSVEP